MEHEDYIKKRNQLIKERKFTEIEELDDIFSQNKTLEDFYKEVKG